MKKKIKTFFVLPTLYAGGAERVMSFIAQNLDEDRFDTTLIIIGLESESKFKVEGIPVIFLNKTRVLRGVFQLSRLIRKNKPQIVISSLSHLNSIMGYIGLFFPKIVFIGRHASILNAPNEKKTETPKKKSFIGSIFNYFVFGLKKLDYIICQSSDMRQSIIEGYNVDRDKVKIINNPITHTNGIKKIHLNGHKIKKYITVGRLSKTKGHLRILDTLGKVDFPFQYTIIGEGDYYDLIIEKIKKLGLEDKVKYINYTNNVFEHLVAHDMFLQGSYSEGFPNALLESCVVGVPVIAFNSPGGTKEIVENEVNGFLVEDEEEYLQKLNDKREWDPEIIRESVYKKFSKNKIIGDYEKLFLEALKNKQ